MTHHEQKPQPIRIPYREIEEIVRRFNTLDWPHLLITIPPNGQISASGIAGRTDLVLGPTHFFFVNARSQPEETILYSFKVLLRHREGYVLIDATS